ncbi:MAG: hypothetical protein V3S69_05360 [Dehalococcoidales bacterium]
MKVKYYKLTLQPCNAMLKVYFDRDILRQHCLKEKEWKLASELDHCDALFIDYGCFDYAMYLPEEYVEQFVWHEALHCTTQMWYDAGGNIHSCENDEVLTYTQGYIVGMIKELYKLREEL